MPVAVITTYRYSCPHCGKRLRTTLDSSVIRLGPGTSKCPYCGREYGDGTKEWNQLSPTEQRRFLYGDWGALVFMAGLFECILLCAAYSAGAWKFALYGTAVNLGFGLVLYGLYLCVHYPIARAAIADSIKRSPEKWGPWIFDAQLEGFALWREMFRAFWKLPLAHRIGYILLGIAALALGILLGKV